MENKTERAIEYLERLIGGLSPEELDVAEDSLRGLLRRVVQAKEAAGPAEIAVPSTPVDVDRPPVRETREMLRALFDADGLRRWTLARWPRLRTRYSPKDTVDDLIDEVLEYARTNLLWDELIAEAASEARTRGIAAVRDQGWNLGAVRSLLVHAFTAEDLRRLALYSPTFRGALSTANQRAGLAELADHLLAWADARDLVGSLVSEVERANPRQYANYEGMLKK